MILLRIMMMCLVRLLSQRRSRGGGVLWVLEHPARGSDTHSYYRVIFRERCGLCTGTGTGNFALQVPAISPPKNLENFLKWEKKKIRIIKRDSNPALARSSTQLATARCCFFATCIIPYHHNTNPWSTIIT